MMITLQNKENDSSAFAANEVELKALLGTGLFDVATISGIRGFFYKATRKNVTLVDLAFMVDDFGSTSLLQGLVNREFSDLLICISTEISNGGYDDIMETIAAMIVAPHGSLTTYKSKRSRNIGQPCCCH